MSQSVWGTINMHIRTFNATPTPITITETKIIADPTTPDTNNTVLESTGYSNSKYNSSGFCSITELGNIISAYKTKTLQQLDVYIRGTMLYSGDCRIESLKYNTDAADGLVKIEISWIGE
jgi:hypothetical protein